MRNALQGKRWLWLSAALAVGMLLLTSGSQNTDASPEERRIAEVLSTMAGAGRVEVALFYAPQENAYGQSSAAGAPTGAVVVAQGAGDWQVRLQLTRAVRTLLGLPENAVDVFVMEETN